MPSLVWEDVHVKDIAEWCHTGAQGKQSLDGQATVEVAEYILRMPVQNMPIAGGACYSKNFKAAE